MTKKSSMFSVVVLQFGLISCAAESVETHPLELRSADATHTSGTYTVRDAVIEFDAQAADTHVLITAQVDGKQFDVDADVVGGVYSVNGHNEILTDPERLALRGMSSALAEYLGANPTGLTQGQQLLISLTGYWAEAPVGYVHARHTMTMDVPGRSNALGNDGIKCVRKNSWYTVTYDAGASGAVSTESVMANANWGTGGNGGNYACMGRCGAGCSGTSIYGRWTQDCLEHDVCSYRYNASGGSSDGNCGDEYDNAFDDFVNVGWYGCGG